jgi:hypothetical protein
LKSKIAFDILLRRFPDLRRSPDLPVQLKMGSAGLFQGTAQSPTAFTPQARWT